MYSKLKVVIFSSEKNLLLRHLHPGQLRKFVWF